MPQEVTVYVDDREKAPFLFPNTLSIRTTGRKSQSIKVKAVKKRLEIADYILTDDKANVYKADANPHTVIIERKHSIEEIANNVGPRRERFCEILQLMADTHQYPILAYDRNPSTLLKASKHVPKPGPILDDLMRLCYHYGVHLQFIPSQSSPQRWAAGEVALRTLINGQYWKGYQHV